ncbi:50S ribosomal protein L10 [Catellatospora sp. IY07-71]|nr:50S ribosomal protein L10 [Catellatospora sp. IY07-71]
MSLSSGPAPPCEAPCAPAPGRFRFPPAAGAGSGETSLEYERGGDMADKIRADKAGTVAELKERFQNSGAVVLTEYRGLTVKQLTDLRRSMGGAEYTVAKNTLAKRAATDAGLTGLDALFTGPTALAFVSGDVVEAAKGLKEFAKANPLLVIKGGVFEGKAITAADVAKLADLESREVLLAKLAGAMKASMSNAAALFQAPLAKAVRTAAALQDKREKEGADA